MELETGSTAELLNAAAEKLQRGDYQNAQSLAQSVLLSEPANLDAAILMIHVLTESGRLGEAARLSLELAETHRDKRELFTAQAAQLWADSGNLSRATETYHTLLAESPDFHAARLGLFRALRSKGFLFQANEQLRELIAYVPVEFNDLVGAIQPTFPSATFTEKPDINDRVLQSKVGAMNMAAALQSRGDVREAIEVLVPSQYQGLRRSEVTAMKAWLLSRGQQWDALSRLLDQADSAVQQFPTYWMALGAVALQRRDSASVTCFAGAIRLEPNLPDAYDGLIQAIRTHADTVDRSDELLTAVQKRRKQVADTRFFVDQIGAGQDRNGRMIRNLGRLLNEMGRPLESLAWQEMAIRQTMPGSPQLRTIAAYKQQVLEKYNTGRNESVVALGIEFKNLPTTEPLLAALRKASDPGDAKVESTERPALPAPSVPVFTDVASELGIRMAYQNATRQILKQFQIHQSLGTGVACLDYDLDGRVDFYFGQGGFEPPNGQSQISNRLFRHVGKTNASAFVDVTPLADADDFGYTHGVTSGDWNQDGLPDLFIGNLGQNQLLINQGDGRFTSVRPERETAAAMWNRGMFTTAIGMADVTGDALPDMIEVNYIDDPKIFDPNTVDGKTLLIGPLYYDAAIDRVFYNDGKGQIVGKALGAGSGLPSTGLGVLVTDIDGHAGNEILVANDLLPNHLWQTQTTRDKPSSPQWTDNAVAAGVAYATNGQPLACMGIAAADFNRDGRLDIHITNYVDEWSNLYLQNQSGVFQDAAAQYGLDIPTNPNVGFGTQAIDYDNNTTWDLVVGNGHTEDFSHRGIAFKMPTQILMRNADGFVAADVLGQDDYWSSNHVARSIARCDFNRDGRVDFALTDLLEPVSLFENRCQTDHHFLQIDLVGRTSERDAIGAEVTVLFDDQTAMQVTQSGDGYLGKNESTLFFGLGNAESVDSIVVRWPDGRRQQFADPPLDSRLLIIQDESSVWTRWAVAEDDRSRGIPR